MYRSDSAPDRPCGTAPAGATLAIGCFASICRDRLGDQLLGFSRARPQVAIGIHEMPRGALFQALAADDIALAIVPGAPDPQFAALRLWSDQAVVALPADHPLAVHATLDAGALADALFLVSRYQHGWDMHRFLAGRVLPGRTLRTALHDLGLKRLLGCVGRGDGIALACRSHVATAGAAVALRPIAGDAVAFDVHAHWNPDRATPALLALIGMLAVRAGA